MPNSNRIELTAEQARLILDCFGPCTTTYECNSAAELVAEFNQGQCGGATGLERMPYTSVQDFVRDLMNVEDVFEDREADAAYHVETGAGPKGHHARTVERLKHRRAEIVQRLRSAGFLPS